MEKHALKARMLLLLFLLFLLLGACRRENSSLLVLRGNYLFNRGEDVLATYNYLRAGRGVDDPVRRSILAYDLGSVFLSLGESGAAAEELEASLTLPGGGGRLRFRGFLRVSFRLRGFRSQFSYIWRGHTGALTR